MEKKVLFSINTLPASLDQAHISSCSIQYAGFQRRRGENAISSVNKG